ncbi:hypothetical protein AB0M94_36490 [Streptomyces xanthochromogenes]
MIRTQTLGQKGFTELLSYGVRGQVQEVGCLAVCMAAEKDQAKERLSG